MLHTLVIIVENKPGVLNRVASLFRRRNYNIESLTVGRTDIPGLSRMTITVEGDSDHVERLTSYLYKLVNVIQVEDLTEKRMVSRDLALIKVNTTSEKRTEIFQMIEIFRARVIDVTNTSLVVEITGTNEKVNGFIDIMKPLGIVEMVRTGAVAMERGTESLLNLAESGFENE